MKDYNQMYYNNANLQYKIKIEWKIEIVIKNISF